MRSALTLAATAIAALTIAAPALAAVPAVQASAYVVEDARTGEVLAASNEHAHLPIASITKLMTVLLTLEHHKLTDVVTVDPRAAAVGESTVNLRSGEQLTVRDLLKATLIQSANDAADALALSVAPTYAAFGTMMNAEAAQLGLHDSHFVRPDGLDSPDEYSSAADATKLGRLVMRTRFVRDTVRERTDTIAGGRVLHTWDDLLSIFPQTIGVKTGHTGAAGWCQVGAARGRGITIYATLLGAPTRAVRNADLESLLAWGIAQFRVVPLVQQDRAYASVDLPFGKAPLALRAAKPFQGVVRIGRPLTERVVAARVVALPVRAGSVLGHVEVWAGTALLVRRDLVASRTINKPGLARRLGWYARRAGHNLMHLL
jgi:serine-type D-Ala-D-Ala carboxypeptidase (penicillin-binding protein 5/6)